MKKNTSLIYEHGYTITTVVQGGLVMINIVCIMKLILTIDLDLSMRNIYVHGLEKIKNTWNEWMNKNLARKQSAGQLSNGGLTSFVFGSS